MRPHLMMTAALLTAIALFSAAPNSVQTDRPDKDTQIAELSERVAALEARLAELEEQTMPLIEQARNEHRRELARAAARARMRQDRGKYSPEVLSEVEQLYQTANKDWRSPATVAALEKLVNDYPDLNRTGCATMYLGQMSRGAERVDYLTRAMTDFADCYYGDGVNVGAYATYYLACYHMEEGNREDAQKLIDKINTHYPDAIDHRGRALSDLIRELQPDDAAAHEAADVVETP